jgi:hypothetical protein
MRRSPQLIEDAAGGVRINLASVVRHPMDCCATSELSLAAIASACLQVDENANVELLGLRHGRN